MQRSSSSSGREARKQPEGQPQLTAVDFSQQLEQVEGVRVIVVDQQRADRLSSLLLDSHGRPSALLAAGGAQQPTVMGTLLGAARNRTITQPPRNAQRRNSKIQLRD